MSENEKVFRNAFRGYNKDDVNAYIASITENANKSVEDAQARVSRAEREVENIKAECDIISRKADELAIESYTASSAVSEKDKEIEEANNAISSLKEKIALLEEVLKKSDGEKEALKNDILLKEEEISSLKAEAEKAIAAERDNVYKEVALKIDDIMAATDDNAKKIIEMAVDKSGKIIADAEMKAETIKNSAESEAKELGKNISIDCYDEFRRFADKTREDVDMLIKSIEDKGNEIKSRINAVNTSSELFDKKESKENSGKDAKKSVEERMNAFLRNAFASIKNRSDDGKKE